MIGSFRHKGLKRLYEVDDARGINVEHLPKLRNILVRLDAARSHEDMNLPGFCLLALNRNYKGYWAVTVRANWRVIFRFAEDNAEDVNYLDYH